MLRKSITLIGSAVVLKSFLRMTKSILQMILKKRENISEVYGAGSYAVITGGAQGIGKAFALHLAEKGFNLILFDIDELQLNLTKQIIQTSYPHIDIITQIVDFTSGVEVFNSLKFINNYDVSILVNNVGIGRGGIGTFSSIKFQYILENIIVNIYPAVFMTKLIIQQMQLRQKRSLIITLSSAAALYPSPFSTVYGATKRFLMGFFESLYLELRGKNIDILTLTPSIVSTRFVHGQKTFLAIEPEDLVRNAMKCQNFQEMGHWKQVMVYYILYKLMRPITNDFSTKFEQ